jgi:Mitochondrial carrier protein
MEHKQDLGHKEHTHHKCSLPDPKQTSTLETTTSASSTTATTTNTSNVTTMDEEQDVSFFHDFVAGGVAGSASVIVGHPLDSIKVRIQTSAGGTGSTSISSMVTGYGGVSSLFRGMSAPLSTACIINAIIFSSYGWSSRLYDDYFSTTTAALSNEGQTSPSLPHDSTIKAFTCGSFAGLVQALVICPQEHVKCRLQVQHGKGSVDNIYKGPVQAAKSIIQQHGLSNGLFRGWWITCWREVPAFGAYFACYDIFKDKINAYFVQRDEQQKAEQEQQQSYSSVDVLATNDNTGSLSMAHHAHTWLSSALAGGLTGALTW